MIERSDVIPDDDKVLKSAQVARDVYDRMVELNDAMFRAYQEGCTIQLYRTSSSIGSSGQKLSLSITMPLVRFKQMAFESHVEVPVVPDEEEEDE